MSKKTFELTDAQKDTLGVLFRLVGLTGVHKRPEQGACIVLDLLPASHVVDSLVVGAFTPQPFCVRVHADGRIEPMSDEDAGLMERPRWPGT
jgi:hypothetical protein